MDEKKRMLREGLRRPGSVYHEKYRCKENGMRA